MAKYRWARGGDVNAFFGLMLDNVAVLVLLVTTIATPAVGAIHFTSALRHRADDPRHGAGRADRRPGLHLDGVSAGEADRQGRRHRHAAGPGHAEHVRGRLPGAAAGPAARHGDASAGPRPGHGLRLARRGGGPGDDRPLQVAGGAVRQRHPPTGAAGRPARLPGGDGAGADLVPATAYMWPPCRWWACWRWRSSWSRWWPIAPCPDKIPRRPGRWWWSARWLTT